MPNLCPGILPLFRSGQRLLCLCAVLLIPRFLFAQPTITSFAPLTGSVGTTVTINGTNFSTTPSSNIVRFGTVTAPVTSATSTSLTVLSPTGASYLPLTVTSGGLTAYSYYPFSTTFNGATQFSASSFSGATTFPAGSGPLGMTAMDFDGDGLTDLAVANGNDNTVTMYLNASTSGVPNLIEQTPMNAPSGYYPQSLATGDLDGDGKPDMVMINSNLPDVIVYQNVSTVGHLTMTQLPPLAETGYGDNWVAIGDLNGDGKPEIVVAELSSSTLAIFPNTSSVGSISFGTPITVYLPSAYKPYAVAIADLDGDGKPDLAFTDLDNALFSVCRNTTATTGGTISFATHVDFAAGNNPQGLAIGDLDNDGRSDIVVANNSDNTLSIYRNTGAAGSISFATTTQVTGQGPWTVQIADMNGDGKLDVVGVSNGSSNISIHQNTGSGPGTITLTANVDYASSYAPADVRLVDIDGNGTPDIAALNQSDIAGDGNGDISVFLNQSPGAPAITSFSPIAGTSGTLVTITGSNFTGATAVNFGGVAATSFMVVNSTTVTAIVGSGATGVVSVVTPNGTASKQTFTYGIPAGPPTITGFQPTTGTYGTSVTIQGTNLLQVSTVTFGNQSALSYSALNDSVLVAVIGAGATGDIYLTSPGGNDTSASAFTYIQPPALTITGFAPTSGPSGTAVTITGTGFLTTPSVTFGGVPASRVNVMSDSVIVAYVNSGASGNVDVSAFNGADSLAAFTYIVITPPSYPALTSFSPHSAATGATITIDGQNLSSVTNVSFGGTAAASFQIVSDSVILAVVGDGSSGVLQISNANTAVSLPNFAYVSDSGTTTGSFQLVTFTASLQGTTPLLQWSTVYDAGISFYAVERGVDGNNFNTIATVKSTDAGGLGASYSYIDSFPNAGVNYYRIKAQDTTAAYSYSTILSVQLLNISMPVYPNPVKYGFFLVDLPSITKPSVFRLTSMAGIVVQTLSVPAGVSQQRIDVPNLVQGAYQLSWTDGTKTSYQTILVLYNK
jgi:hypothetical protein